MMTSTRTKLLSWRSAFPMITALLLSVTTVVVVFPAAAETTVQTDTSEAYLVQLGNRRLFSSDIGAVREVGFGWYVVEPRPGDMDLRSRLSDMGVTFEVDATYELFAEPLYPQQWALENTGQTGGTVDADIDAPEAWAWTSGSPDQIVAVIDGGVDLGHPDLVARLWTNTAEIPGNGIDDDGNGYIDDVNGWDMVDGDAVPQDTLGHGTAVAGVISASLNGVGIVGVAPESTIMPIRVCQTTSCPLSNIVEGIQYALDNGARILNLSLGSPTFNQSLADAVSTANDKGAVVVASAGNNGSDNDTFPMYPASFEYPNVIAVAASDDNDALVVDITWASNYGGTSVDLTAPGQSIVTTGIDGSWGSASGTSFSAPFVTGVIALMRTLQPNATPGALRRSLLETVDVLASLDGKVVSGGRLNAGGALQQMLTPVALASVTPPLETFPFTATFDATASRDPSETIMDFSWTFPDGQTMSEPIITWAPPAPGRYAVTLAAVNGVGLSAEDTVEVLAGIGFTDTTTSIFRLDVAWISAFGITRGCNPPDNDQYCPQDPVTREQMAAFLARALDLPVATTDYFTDDDGSIFENDINSLAQAGITRGCNPPENDRYCPQDPVTREQMAALLRRSGVQPDRNP